MKGKAFTTVLAAGLLLSAVGFVQRAPQYEAAGCRYEEADYEGTLLEGKMWEHTWSCAVLDTQDGSLYSVRARAVVVWGEDDSFRTVTTPGFLSREVVTKTAHVPRPQRDSLP